MTIMIPSEVMVRIEKAARSKDEFVKVKPSDLKEYLKELQKLDNENFKLNFENIRLKN